MKEFKALSIKLKIDERTADFDFFTNLIQSGIENVDEFIEKNKEEIEKLNDEEKIVKLLNFLRLLSKIEKIKRDFL